MGLEFSECGGVIALLNMDDWTGNCPIMTSSWFDLESEQ